MGGRLLAIAVAFCVMAGRVLAHFTSEIFLPAELSRPLAVVTIVAIVVGVLSVKAGDYAVVVAAVVSTLLISPNQWGFLFCALVGLLIVGGRIVERPVTLHQPLVAAAAVFLLVGALRAVPLIPLPSSVAHAAPIAEGPPVYLVLLDGYPRLDGLAALGIDNRSFVAQLEERGFDHYPDAHSLHTITHRTLTAMLTGNIGENRYGTLEERRAEQAEWTLPPGFVTVPPFAAQVTISNARDVGPGGINGFDIRVIGSSLLGHVPGIDNLLLDARRDRVDESLQTIATAEESHVFAHLLVPHPPFLYGEDGSPFPAPGCWPGCITQWMVAGDVIPRKEWLPGLAGTLAYLNARLIETIDSILVRRPDAVIVLFSDHGGRLSIDDHDEWFETFLVARTPEHPRLFEDSPRPDMVLRLLTDPG